jgi:IMP cyclohydrolase
MHNVLMRNLNNLKLNVYPGRGIVIGMSPDSTKMVQIYWIMGRSENSRNRIFVLEENKDVQNAAFDESKLIDPSLIIYKPIRSLDKVHIISNGDQTETIYRQYKQGGSFEKAINEREFEPDAPNFTPRISGVVDLFDQDFAYKLSIIKSFYNNSEVCIRNVYSFSESIPGIGHCLTTYKGNGNPIPSFEGEPFILPVTDNIKETLDLYWNVLNEQNRISVLVKHIDIQTNQIEIEIKNKLSM